MHLDDSRLAIPQHGYIERVCFRSIGEGFNHLLYGGPVRHLPRVAGLIVKVENVASMDKYAPF